MIAQSKIAERKKKISPHQEPIVRGKFPSKTQVFPKPAVLKVNTVLASTLAAAVFFSMTSYLGVVAKENKIKDLHASTNKLNYENIELQNKVDYLKSFYTIDNKVQNIDFLKKADKVIEVNKLNSIPIRLDRDNSFDVTTVPGY